MRDTTLGLKRGQIYLVDFGDTAGSEVKKRRPAVIVQNDIGNLYAPTTIVVPISHRPNKHQPTQIEIRPEMLISGLGNVDGMILCEQVRTVDRSRIRNIVGMLSPEGMIFVDNGILIAMGIKKEA